MTLALFVKSLLADGRVRVPAALDRTGTLRVITPDDLDETTSLLVAFESEYRDELPGNPPAISRPALLWGAMTTFRVSSFLAHRDANDETIRQAMRESCPESLSPSVCYSVDLTLRFLPDLVRLAKAVSANDPLVEILMELARQWPISSVGIANVGPVDTQAIVDDPCLLRLYVDRIIASKDQSRFDEPRVRDAVLAAIGAHPELAPEFAN